MMSVSNFADWFVPNATATTTETAQEPEATDQSSPDFAALLAASYVAAPSIPAPPVVPPIAAEVQSSAMDAQQVMPAFTLPTYSRATILAPTVPIPAASLTDLTFAPAAVTMTDADARITSPAEMVSDDQQTGNSDDHPAKIRAAENVNHNVPDRTTDVRQIKVSTQVTTTHQTDIQPSDIARQNAPVTTPDNPQIEATMTDSAPLSNMSVTETSRRDWVTPTSTAETSQTLPMAEESRRSPQVIATPDSLSSLPAPQEPARRNVTSVVVNALVPVNIASNNVVSNSRAQSSPTITDVSVAPDEAAAVVLSQNNLNPVPDATVRQPVSQAPLPSSSMLPPSMPPGNDRGEAISVPDASVDNVAGAPLFAPTHNQGRAESSAGEHFVSTEKLQQISPDLKTLDASASSISDPSVPIKANVKAENRTVEDTLSTLPQSRAAKPTATTNAPARMASAPSVALDINPQPTIGAFTQPVNFAQKALPLSFEAQAPILPEIVKLAAAVVKTILTEQARSADSLSNVVTNPTPDVTAVPVAVTPVPVGGEQIQISQAQFSVHVGTVPVTSEPQPIVTSTNIAPTENFTITASSPTFPPSSSPTLPASFSSAPSKATNQTLKSLGIETIDPATARAPIVSASAEAPAPTFAQAPLVVADPSGLDLPSPTLPLEFRESVPVEALTDFTTVQGTPATASVSVPPTVNTAPAAPAPPISQTVQPVLELANSVPPQESRTLRFSLNPAELGRVDVEVTRDAEGRVSASLTVEQADTAQTLTQGIGQLRESLERAGLVVEQLQIATQLQPQTAQQFGQQTGQQADQPQTAPPHNSNADSSLTDPTLGGSTIPGSENKLLSLHA
jgi:hypothetical protein